MEEIYYKSSGKAPIGGVLSAIIAGLSVSVVLAIVYIALQWFIPIVYFNFLITLGLAFAVFYVIDFLCKTGKVRNRSIALLFTLLCSLTAYYAQWCLFVSLMFNAEGTMGGDMWVKSSFNLDGFLYFLSHPLDTFAGIQELNEVGTFSLKKSVVSGWPLWILWTIEAAAIVGYPLFLAFSGKTSTPFSEKDNEWMNKRELEKPIAAVQDKESLLHQLKGNDFKSLHVHLQEEELGNEFATVTVYESPGDDHQYISIVNHKLESNKKGEVVDKKKDIITYFRIPAHSL
ncbi:hypothetical protein LZQ00_14905 [Sphingobacterium sp. SRCM116780]|uniref:hypothetical protein n=1 Tax=Sphingobacterium sp. SRCM116780 TaxID=2907623 RepID=UPI001F485851|nr:hypothetical protein [Sphingobacterium sp. SRCM116780]UIR55547.1 hypothetical protein LZQ00_14905 [Sphingobacterium sp. SRCM116780]